MKQCSKTKALDVLVQLWSCQQRSAYDIRLNAEAGHHVVKRANELLRWDIKNIMPLTYEEHGLIEQHKISVDWKHQHYLDEMKNKSFKQELLRMGLTRDEFLQERLEYWKGLVE